MGESTRPEASSTAAQPQRPLLIHGGRVFTADRDRPWAEAVVVVGGDVVFVGDEAEAVEAAGTDAARVDAAGGLIMPGFVDGHVHLEMTGASLGQAQLRDAADVAGIQERLLAWKRERPTAPRVVGTGWVHGVLPAATPTKEMIDEVLPDIPTYLLAYDYHSAWVNSAALAELGIDDDTPDPLGGSIVRDPDTGHATGWLLETAAIEHVWALLERAGATDRAEHRRLALAAYAENGITTVVDMAMTPDALDGLRQIDAAGRLTARVVAHMIVMPTGDIGQDLAQVARAAELAASTVGDRLRVTGIKLIGDGTVDACTAAMFDPFTTGANGDLMWTDEQMNAVVAAADAAGLQVAIHAIGDRAIRQAIDALVAVAETDPGRERRHRIEHLEITAPEDIGRLSAAGIVASMQPVHADPEILPNWCAMLGDDRCQHGFAWPLYLRDGGRLVLGTDTPTAPLEALPNMYIATTRRSPRDQTLDPHRPDWALASEQALECATRESAWAARMEHRVGTLRPGMAADLIVVDADVVAEGPDALLDAHVVLTMMDGVVVHGDDPRLVT